jgi:uncharacterized protein GlcG (DUF336 family)
VNISRIFVSLLIGFLPVVMLADKPANPGSQGKGHSGSDDADEGGSPSACKDLPTHAQVLAALKLVVPGPTNAANQALNGGLGNNMWATLVNRDGVVCVVAFSGADRGAQWPGSRVISGQKANTANAFSLTGFALSTANLFSAVQPGASLYGLQHSNPVDVDLAYGGNSSNNGQANDFMVGGKIGGVNVFGGGLALYNASGVLLGGVGVSGDTSCTDHIVAWKLRWRLNLDNVPAGVAGAGKDNIIFDLAGGAGAHANGPSAGGFGHPSCDGVGVASSAIATGLPVNFPPGPAPAP